jgi:hypothetical protein
MRDPESKRICPDGGTCHHKCALGCWRVDVCGPLSGVYPDDAWPESVTSVNPPYQQTGGTL